MDNHFTFQISQLIFITFCHIFWSSFHFGKWCPTNLLLTLIVSFFIISSIYPFIVAPLLPSTFCNICDPITSTFVSLKNIKKWSNFNFLMMVHVTRIVIDSMKSKEDFGSIVGSQNHCHREKRVIDENVLSKKLQ